MVERKPARRSIGAQRNPESEAAILEAAEAVLLEGGLSGFTIEAVAKRAHAGKPTIYRWWPSKAALLLDVYHRHKHSNFTYIDTGTIRGDLKDYLLSLIDAWRKETTGAIFRSLVAEAQADPATSEALATYMAERRRQAGEMIRRGQARGEVRPDAEPEIVTEMIAAFAWSRLLTNRLEMSEAEIEAFLDLLLAGIRNPQA